MSKLVLVTGGSQGIGAEIVRRFASDGYNVAINCYNEQIADTDGKALVEECEKLGVKAACFCGDVSNFEVCQKMTKDVLETFGSIDVLVNNAGVTNDGLLVRMKEDQFDKVISVNLKGTFNMMHFVGAVMQKQKHGRIINVSSVAGAFGNAGQVNYSASKAGVIGMTMSAAKELGPRNITVNAVAPGFIQTAMTDVLSDKIKQAAIDAIPLKRFGKPEEVAGTIAFLASDAAGFISGQTIVIDGAMIF